MAKSAYLIRHGDYELGNSYSREKLTPTGIEQSEAARDELIARELGGRAYLLSSTAPRAIETAAIIGEGLHTEVLPSTMLRRGSSHPDAVENLGAFLRNSLETDFSIEADSDRPFVVVCHAPLVVVFTGHETASDLEKGRVYEVPEDSTNPEYEEGVAELVFNGELD